MRDYENLHAAVIGPESMDNLRLADTLRQILGPTNVFRQLELPQMARFATEHAEHFRVIIIDVLNFDLVQVTHAIGEMRENYPEVVFVLYVDGEIYTRREFEFPNEWRGRFKHYYRLYKSEEDAGFEPIVRLVLQRAFDLAEVNKRMDDLSKEAENLKNSLDAVLIEEPPRMRESKIFISYSRADWDSFVVQLVAHLKAHGVNVWVDQHLLVGGADWMDSIGEALDTCERLILVMSPEALASSYVKMEYRYFINHQKPVIPVLWRTVSKYPFELATIHYIDFSMPNTDAAYQQLYKVLNSDPSPSA